MPTDTAKKHSPLLYSCYTQVSREGESFIPEHAFIRILSGSLQVHTISGNYTFTSGDTVLFKRNQLIKVVKLPAPDADFKSVSVYFDQPILKDYALENRIGPSAPYTGEPVLVLKSDSLYESYASSLAAYSQGPSSAGLTTLKVKEALMLVLHLNREANDLLFDFCEPGKIDLEQYMNTHFKFNVNMSRFAYLTGRSLATFKRDFNKIFQTSPNKWLQERRLKEAHYLIKEKRMKISEVYLEVGFEDLSHFSFAFKNAFGKSPSLI